MVSELTCSNVPNLPSHLGLNGRCVTEISYKTNNIAKGSGSAGGVGAGCGGGDSHSVVVQKAIPAPALSQID